MQQQFVETIKIANGKPSNLPYHQARMERTIRHFFPNLALRSMPCLEKLIAASDDMALVKARVVYGADGVELIEYAPYSMRTISSLQVSATTQSATATRVATALNSTLWLPRKAIATKS